MTGQTCALPECNKPPCPSVGRITPHSTCGDLHHQLLMAARFNPSLPHPYQAILNRNDNGLCAWLSCKKPPCLDHSCCSSHHYLLWLTEFTANLHPDQICKLPGCTRHVFVNDKAPPSQFCGWQHQQKFVMLSALNQQEAIEADPEEPRLPAPSIEISECGLVPSLDSLLDSVKRFAQSGIRPKNMIVVEDFYEKHPWDVFTEGHACSLIARLRFTSRGTRKLTTKGPFHWKQSGPQAKKNNLYTAKYYTYMKRKAKEEEGDAESSYTMKEYTLEGVEWSLMQLVKEKEKPSSQANPRKEQRTQQQNNACSQDSWMDFLNLDESDDMDLCT